MYEKDGEKYFAVDGPAAALKLAEYLGTDHTVVADDSQVQQAVARQSGSGGRWPDRCRRR